MSKNRVEKLANKGEPFHLLFALYLSPNGVIISKETMAYDFQDFIGDVGGFLGLFLGASLLSVYDEVRQKVRGIMRRKGKIEVARE